MRVIVIYDPDEEETYDDAEIILNEIRSKMEDDYPEIEAFDVEADN